MVTTPLSALAELINKKCINLHHDYDESYSNSLDTVRKGSSTGFPLNTLNRRQITKKVEHIRFLNGDIERFFLDTNNTISATILSNIKSNLLTFEGTARRMA